MSKFYGDWWSRFAAAAVFLLTVVMFVSATRAQVGPSPSPQSRKRNGAGRGQNLAIRPACEVAAALSTLLGLSNGEECFVIQGVVRTRKVVQGFKGQFHDYPFVKHC